MGSLCESGKESLHLGKTLTVAVNDYGKCKGCSWCNQVLNVINNTWHTSCLRGFVQSQVEVRHLATHLGSIFCRRFFLRFSRITQRASEAGERSHFSMSSLPSSGSAATATLQQ